MRIIFFYFGLFLMFSCQDSFPAREEENIAPETKRSTVSFSLSNPNTNISATNVDNRVKTVRVLIFDPDGSISRYNNSLTNTSIPNNQRFPVSGYYPSDRTSITIETETTPGKHNIYLVANEDSETGLAARLAGVTTEQQLLDLKITYTTLFTPSETTPFLMTANLLNQAIKPYSRNEINISLVRTLSRVTVNLNQLPPAVFTNATSWWSDPTGIASCYIIDAFNISSPPDYSLISKSNPRILGTTTPVIHKTSTTDSWTSYINLINTRKISITHDRSATTVFYIPENLPENPYDLNEGLPLHFKVIQRQLTGTNSSPYYTETSESHTYSTILEYQKTPGDIISYAIPRNSSLTVNAEIRNWTPENIYVKTEIRPWNKDTVTEEFGPTEYEWGTWIDDITIGTLPAAIELRESEATRIGIRLRHPIGRRWHVSLSNGYDFEFTPESVTSGEVPHSGTNPPFLKFSVRPTRPYNSGTDPNHETKVYITVDNKRVPGAVITIRQIP
ncbi:MULTISPECIES: fimbrial protein [Sanguibacteroides]|uniref:Major fimbrial subunit protein N-terminal domain-containing protein n=1 Tax=Sanguibacteroides justesenii TaxID=1547597 RepID=A0A0C3REG5_9PORP|nr:MULTISPECIES: fimbrial protein [Sanguibacteroides]KIO43161.1 hypothetical protein IE90_13210 [Sanguibacteroides justesenii]KIO44876.1 hypothetical protein BA92_07610 [Sanguibacteroides justesenii]PXZ43087.1 hypothetical protein DMB45_11875 [Sanguibacteroides justesenii]